MQPHNSIRICNSCRPMRPCQAVSRFFRSIDIASDCLHGPFTVPVQDGPTSPVDQKVDFGGWLMKYAKQMLALALTLLPALAAAQLHSGERILAQVPFE